MRGGSWLIWTCCTLYVAVVVIPTGLYVGIWRLATGEDAAAWVQAFGSIAAILGTGFLGVLQIREGRKAANRARAHALSDQHQALQGVWSSAVGLIVRAEAALGPLVENSSNPAERLRWASDITPIVATLVDLQELLRSFPSYLFANAPATVELTSVLTSLHTAEMALHRLAESKDPSKEDEGYLIKRILDNTQHQITQSLEHIKDAWKSVDESHAIAYESALSGYK